MNTAIPGFYGVSPAWPTQLELGYHSPMTAATGGLLEVWRYEKRLTT